MFYRDYTVVKRKFLINRFNSHKKLMRRYRSSYSLKTRKVKQILKKDLVIIYDIINEMAFGLH